MKLTKFFLFGAAALALASCSNEDLTNPSGSGKEATVSMEISLPTMQTRAFGDGTTAVNLQYAVYENTTEGLKRVVDVQEKEMTGKTATIDEQLVKGKTYTFVFWAGKDTRAATDKDKKSPYQVTFGDTGATMTCYNEGNMVYPESSWWKINNDNLDAFFATKEITIEGNKTEKVEMKRATAQINLGTNDYDRAQQLGLFKEIADLNAEVRIENVYKTLDLVTGAVSDPINKKFYFGDLDEDFIAEKYPVEEGDYKYFALVYAIVAPDQELVTVSYGFSNDIANLNADDHKVTNVPVQRNRRTNIYGSLLTDVMTIQVEIVDDFDEPGFDQNLDNQIAEGVFYDAKTKTYTLTTATGLKWMQQHNEDLADHATGMKGYTVELGCDIDLNNEPWTPMHNASGVFDGKNYRILNLNVDLTNENSDASAGFFAEGRGTVKNLTIENASVKGHYKVGVVAGDGLCATFENVHVKNANVLSLPWKKNGTDYDDGNNAGGIVGYLSCEASGGITGCSVENSSIRAYRKVGGLTGYAQAYDSRPVTIEGNRLYNVTVIADLFTNAYSNKTPDCGEFVGGFGKNVTLGENKAEKVITGVTRKDEEGNFEVNTFADLQALAALKATDYQGKTIKLMNDIDMKDVEFEAVKFYSSNKVTFDGQNHYIRNITVPTGQNGLFKDCQMNIKNLKIDGFVINITSGGKNENYIGLVNNLYGDMENVEMTNVDISQHMGTAAALVGIHNGGNMKNCKVSKAKIFGTNRVGVLAGRVNEGKQRSYSGCIVESVDLTCNNTNYRGLFFGNINTTGISLTNCRIENCKINGEDSNVGIAYLDASTEGITVNGIHYSNGKLNWDEIWAEASQN